MTQEELAKQAYDRALQNRDQLILDKINAGLDREEAESIVERDLAGMRTRCDNLKAQRLMNEEWRQKRQAAAVAEIHDADNVHLYG